MKHTTLLAAAAAIAAALLSGCKSQYEMIMEGNDPELKYTTAFELFNQGKYTKAAALFESLALITSGTERDDTVQYYWGLSNYSARDYYTAETNFTRFIGNFPLSPFVDEARFMRIDCLYRSTLRWELDQAPTYKAMTVITDYLTDYPEGANSDICRHMLEDLNERLDRKAFENAKLYYKMEDYQASGVALRNVLKDDADNVYREEILYYAAMSSYKYAFNSIAAKQKERYLIFVDDYLNFIGEYPESSHRKELDGLYRKVKEII